jgi:hypothetical protein
MVPSPSAVQERGRKVGDDFPVPGQVSRSGSVDLVYRQECDLRAFTLFPFLALLGETVNISHVAVLDENRIYFLEIT